MKSWHPAMAVRHGVPPARVFRPSASYNNTALSVDPSASGHVLAVTGVSQTNLPTNFSSVPGINEAAFVAKLNSTGSSLLWSTYLGGVAATYGSGIATDGLGDVFVAGSTGGQGFPATASALPPVPAGIFLTEIKDATDACSAYAQSGKPDNHRLRAGTYVWCPVARWMRVGRVGRAALGCRLEFIGHVGTGVLILQAAANTGTIDAVRGADRGQPERHDHAGWRLVRIFGGPAKLFRAGCRGDSFSRSDGNGWMPVGCDERFSELDFDHIRSVRDR
jgi:hypothetical protein